MTTFDTRTTIAATAMTHPAWCDKDLCTVDPDLPLDDALHLSKPIEIDVAISAAGPINVDVWLHQGAADSNVYLVVDVLGTGRAMLPVPAAASTVAALTALIEQATTGEGADRS